MADMSQDAARIREALKDIVAEHGADVLSDRRAMPNLVKDVLPDSPVAARMLVVAAEEGVADKLLDQVAQGVETDIAIKLSASTLAASTLLPLPACALVVAELAVALGLANTAMADRATVLEADLAAHQMTAYGTATTAETRPEFVNAARLLEEAEQLARSVGQEYARAVAAGAVPAYFKNHGLDSYSYQAHMAALARERAEVLTYVAAAVAYFDPAHAARLLDDAQHPPWPTTLRPEMILGYLLQSCAPAVGVTVARIDQATAQKLLDDVDRALRLLTQHGGLDALTVGVAEAVAYADAARATRIAGAIADGHRRAEAQAKVAIVAARSSASMAEEITRAIRGGRLGLGQRRGKEQVPRDVAGYWRVHALTAIVGGLAARTADAWTRVDPAHATALLAEAGNTTRAITAVGDWRARALAEIAIARIQIDPGQAKPLITEAERVARTIADDDDRLSALGDLAMALGQHYPAQAEQIARSLLPRPDKLAGVASAVASADPARAKQIAQMITSAPLQALSLGEVAVRTDLAGYGTVVEQTEAALRGDPAHVIELALIVASLDSDKAEQIVRRIPTDHQAAAVKPRDHRGQRRYNQIREVIQIHSDKSADYWLARGLSSLASLSESQPEHWSARRTLTAVPRRDARS